MRDQIIYVRMPEKLIQALDELAVLAVSDGLSKAPTRSEIIRALLAEGIRAGNRRPAR